MMNVETGIVLTEKREIEQIGIKNVVIVIVVTEVNGTEGTVATGIEIINAVIENEAIVIKITVEGMIAA